MCVPALTSKSVSFLMNFHGSFYCCCESKTKFTFHVQ